MLTARDKQVTIRAVMGANPMDLRRRGAVLEASFRTSATTLASARGHAA